MMWDVTESFCCTDSTRNLLHLSPTFKPLTLWLKLVSPNQLCVGSGSHSKHRTCDLSGKVCVLVLRVSLETFLPERFCVCLLHDSLSDQIFYFLLSWAVFIVAELIVLCSRCELNWADESAVKVPVSWFLVEREVWRSSLLLKLNHDWKHIVFWKRLKRWK